MAAKTEPPKIVRVILEYENGKVTEVTGEDATKWQSAVGAAIMVTFSQGVPFPPIPWKTIREEHEPSKS